MKYAFFLFCALSVPLFAQSAGDIEGLWYMHPDKNGNTALAKIFTQDGRYSAFSFAYTNAGVSQSQDAANPKPALRNRLLRGLVFLRDLQFSDGSWKNGNIYNPENGKNFRAKAKLSPDKDTLTIRASVDGAGLFGTTFIWRRADPKYAPLAEGAALH